jgi:hypothetical protein
VDQQVESKTGASYGKLEFVSDLEQADILILVARGSDTMAGVVRMEALDGVEVLRPCGSKPPHIWSLKMLDT